MVSYQSVRRAMLVKFFSREEQLNISSCKSDKTIAHIIRHTRWYLAGSYSVFYVTKDSRSALANFSSWKHHWLTKNAHVMSQTHKTYKKKDTNSAYQIKILQNSLYVTCSTGRLVVFLQKLLHMNSSKKLLNTIHYEARLRKH